MTRALQGKAPALDKHRLLLCHDNGSLRYDHHTIDIIAYHYILIMALDLDYGSLIIYYSYHITLSHYIIGKDKTIGRITQRLYWPIVFHDVDKYCWRSPECQRAARGSQLKVPLVPLPVMKEPFEQIARDIVGPLPHSKRGNWYILVVCDYMMMYPEAIPFCSIDADTVSEHLMQLLSRVGIPREILSDQGINFMSQLLKKLYNLLNISQIWTSPYHPHTDGSVERFNRTLKAMLRKLVRNEGKDWDSLLPYFLLAYCEVPQSTIVRWRCEGTTGCLERRVGCKQEER